MSIIPLISISVLYFTIALLKPQLQKILKLNICAICLAVSVTWFTMIPLFFLDTVGAVSLAILMGMSITGLMYKLEEVFKKGKLHNFWLARIILVIGGYYLISAFLREQWNWLIMLSIFIPLGIFISAIFFQGTKHQGVYQKLEDCC